MWIGSAREIHSGDGAMCRSLVGRHVDSGVGMLFFVNAGPQCSINFRTAHDTYAFGVFCFNSLSLFVKLYLISLNLQCTQNNNDNSTSASNNASSVGRCDCAAQGKYAFHQFP